MTYLIQISIKDLLLSLLSSLCWHLSLWEGLENEQVEPKNLVLAMWTFNIYMKPRQFYKYP